MTWVWIVLAAWALLAVVCALVIGRSIRLAERKRRESSNFVVDEALAPAPRAPQRAGVPVPHDLPAADAGRRSAVHSAVQNCVPATERSVASEPRVPRPRS